MVGLTVLDGMIYKGCQVDLRTWWRERKLEDRVEFSVLISSLRSLSCSLVGSGRVRLE